VVPLASAAIFAALEEEGYFEATFLLASKIETLWKLQNIAYKDQDSGAVVDVGRLLPVAMARVIGQETERR